MWALTCFSNELCLISIFFLHDFLFVVETVFPLDRKCHYAILVWKATSAMSPSQALITAAHILVQQRDPNCMEIRHTSGALYEN